ncbi:MAG: lysylphosphatidylglycerol synthase transmembrane domain-containing protein [Candidatus Micrarchaeaceae archaeon]
MANPIWSDLKSGKEVNREEYLKIIRRIKYFIIIGMGASLAVFIGIAVFGGIYKVSEVILSAKLYIYAIAFVFVFCGYLIRFLKWNYYLKKLGVHVGLKKNLIIYLSLYSMNITPGKVGRVVSAYTLSKITGEKTSKIMPAVTMDIFTDFIGFAVFALFFSIYAHRFVLYILAADVVLLLPFFFVTHDWLYRKLKNLLKRFKGKGYLGLFSVYGDEYFSSQSELNNFRTYVVSLLVTLPADFLTALALFITLASLGILAPVGGTIFVFSSSQIFGMVSGLPGSIGVSDGTLVALVGGVFSQDSIISSAATIMTRIATLWFGIVVGAIFLFYSLRYWDFPNHIKKASRIKAGPHGHSSRI